MVYFSVVMATNAIDRFFFEAVRTIENQSYRDFEFIIVLNGVATAWQATLEQRYEDPRVKICCSDFRYLNGALNLGVHRAKGDYIVRMDADDIADSSRLATLRQAIDEARQAPIVLYSDFDFIDENGQISENSKPLPSIGTLRRRNMIAHPTVAIKREALLDLGGYLGSVFAEDYDLWARVLRQYGPDAFQAIPKKLMWYRIGVTGAARNSRLAYFGVAAVQLREFLLTNHPAWALGGLETIAKGFWRGT